MEKITAPLHLGDKNDAVANLQDTLSLLVERGTIKLDPTERATLLDALRSERREQVYGATTQRLVILFRIQRRLNDLDWVNNATVAVLNKLLGDWELLEEMHPFVVSGSVTFSDGRAAVGYCVQAFDRDLRNEQLLGEATMEFKPFIDLIDTLGKVTTRLKAFVQLPRAERRNIVSLSLQ